MIVETGLCSLGKLEICVEMRAIVFVSSKFFPYLSQAPYLNAFSSSITWIPWSYCSLVGASPTEAKWPFIVITEGAVGYLDAADGLLSWPFILDDISLAGDR